VDVEVAELQPTNVKAKTTTAPTGKKSEGAPPRPVFQCFI